MATREPTDPATRAPTHPSTTGSATNVDQTILIAVSVIAGVLFLALLGWGIWSTQRHVRESENTKNSKPHKVHRHRKKEVVEKEEIEKISIREKRR